MLRMVRLCRRWPQAPLQERLSGGQAPRPGSAGCLRGLRDLAEARTGSEVAERRLRMQNRLLQRWPGTDSGPDPSKPSRPSSAIGPDIQDRDTSLTPALLQSDLSTGHLSSSKGAVPGAGRARQALGPDWAGAKSTFYRQRLAVSDADMLPCGLPFPSLPLSDWWRAAALSTKWAAFTRRRSRHRLSVFNANGLAPPLHQTRTLISGMTIRPPGEPGQTTCRKRTPLAHPLAHPLGAPLAHDSEKEH